MLIFEELAEHHDLTQFRSGNSNLDGYLQREALDRQRRGEVRVFILLDIDQGHNRPLGYIALAATGYYIPTLYSDDASVAQETFQYVAMLAFLARDVNWRGQGIGKVLVLEAIRQCVLAAQHIGLPGIFLETTKEGAPLYERFGFSWIDQRDGYMYLPMTKARAIIDLKSEYD